MYSLGPGATKDYAVELLRDIVPDERVVFQMSTENLVSNENLLALTSVLQNAELPLTPDRIERI
ncbi:MAG TPA: hypothetical protein VMX75_07630 [Spirochaetia bacterium]|nr:hypothetical protein [Spirochaetia bacterium]